MNIGNHDEYVQQADQIGALEREVERLGEALREWQDWFAEGETFEVICKCEGQEAGYTCPAHGPGDARHIPTYDIPWMVKADLLFEAGQRALAQPTEGQEQP